jgi:hypothetical protein
MDGGRFYGLASQRIQRPNGSPIGLYYSSLKVRFDGNKSPTSVHWDY